MELWAAAVIFASFLLAGLVKGVIGMGLPTVAMGLLALVVAPAEAAALLVIPSVVTNIWQMAAGPSLRPLLGRLWPMMLGIVAGTALGAFFISISQIATTGLGVALVIYALIGLTSWRMAVPDGSERWLGPIVGAATGGITAATGVSVIPSAPYLQALGLERDDLVQALGLSFTVSFIALAGALLSEGVFTAALGGASLAALVPAALGMMLGQWIRVRIKPAVFKTCFFTGLLLLGAHLALRPFL